LMWGPAHELRRGDHFARLFQLAW